MFSWIHHWPRQALIVFAAALALLAFGSWRTWALIVAKPQPTVDYAAQLQDLVESDQPLGANAWEAYRDLNRRELGLLEPQTAHAERYLSLREQLRDSEFWKGRWDERDRSDLVELIDSSATLLEGLDHASGLRRFAPEYREEFLVSGRTGGGIQSVHFTEMGSLESMARTRLAELNAAALRVAAEREDWDEFERRFETGWRMAMQHFQAPLVPNQLAATRFVAHVRLGVVHALQEKTMPVATARRLLQVIDEHPLDFDSIIERVMRSDQLATLNQIQWDHSASGVPFETRYDHWAKLDGAPFPLNRFHRILGPWSPGRAQAERDASSLAQHFLELVNEPARDLAERRWRMPPGSMSLHPTVAGSTGPQRAMARATRTTQSHIAGLRVLLLIEINKRERGVWPETLIEAMPTDNATDPASGELFIYERTPEDEHGRPYVVRIPWLPERDTNAILNPPRERLTPDPNAYR